MTGHIFSRRSALLTFLGLAGVPALAVELGLAGGGGLDGGTTDRSDRSAPKTIQSRDITGFQAVFYLSNRWTAKDSHQFRFQVKKDAAGVLTASEEISAVSRPADAQLLAALQAVIEKQKLAQENGVYRVTSGLPPEYQPCRLQVDYASGEVLRFTRNNNPYAQWSEAFYDIFAAWFAEKGEEALYPEKETSPLTRLDITVRDSGRIADYGGTKVPGEKAIDGETYLLNKRIFDNRTEKSVENAYMLFPQDYYARVTAIIAATDLVRNYDFSRYDHRADNYGNHEAGYYGMGRKTTADDEPDSDSLSLELYLEYASGRRLTIETKKPSEIEAMHPIIRQLLDYHETLFKTVPHTKSTKAKKTP